jgi:microcystin-dependent protein
MPILLGPVSTRKPPFMAKIATSVTALALCLGLSAAPLAHAQNATLGEIKTFAFDYCPSGALAANGGTRAVQSDTMLYTVTSNAFGGNGTITFALPDLTGRAMIGKTDATAIGAQSGSASTVLTASHLPVVFGPPAALSDRPPSPSPSSALGLVQFPGGMPVPTMPPYLAMTQCISNDGTFPTAP